MVTAEIFTNSLFDEFKPPFEAAAFQDEILTADVQRAIFMSSLRIQLEIQEPFLQRETISSS